MPINLVHNSSASGSWCRPQSYSANLVRHWAQQMRYETLTATSVPPNVSFFVDDVEEEWTYTSPFDFIYLRAMTGSIRSWPKLFSQAYQ